MATIKISDLHPAGSEFFIDSESYLNDLTENEIENLLGAGWYIRFSFNNRGIQVCFSWAWR
ncbi:hypothetical protein FD723_05565 [Nostoc sp. C052]|uniref:hypothetical protein n=1 Tax=Nostoc sp. C052 TaxID=2576902 RepID=UPI0015C3DDCC|nr:hypothetical protein [Nostoc sp. C052]QLE39981.1 hypothetical protein FD723_05565 [Nostoc sp. C052]